MSSRRKWLTILVMIVCVLMVLGSWLPTGLSASFWSSFLLQVGSTVGLVPVVLYVQNSLERRVEKSKREVIRGLEGAQAVSPAAKWEDVFPALERIGLTKYVSELFVQVPNTTLWLGFSTFKEYSQGVDGSRISIYYADPTQSQHPSLDAFVPWTEGMTLDIVAERIRKIASYIPKYQNDGPIAGRGIANVLKEEIAALIG